MMAVVMLPLIQLFPRVLHRNNFVDVEEPIAQSTVEDLDEPFVRGLSGPREVEWHAAAPSLFVERIGRKLRTVV
jgi:hypothetical protein